MSKIESGNEYLELKQQTNRDARDIGVLTSAKYEATSTLSQTVINLSFTVTQTTEQKRGFQLFIDGNLLREGASNDFTFTGIVGGLSSQVTLTAPIAADLNILAYNIGGYSNPLPSASSVQASVNSVSLQLDKKGNFNRIINGSFEYWQRNTSFVAPVSGTYLADRWIYNKNSTAVHTVSRDADVPTSAFGVYSMNSTITTADASVAAGDILTVGQYIEGNIFRSLKSKNCVLQFWVKSPKTGIHCVSFLNSAQNRSLIKEYTVNAANTWELKQIRFNHDTTGTWLYDTGIGMRIFFALMAGTTYQGTVNLWSSTQTYATSNQVNVCDTIGNSFKLADVMLVEDNTTTDSLPDFVMAGSNVGEELLLCQRYYEKTYLPGVAPGTIVGQGCFSSSATTIQINGMAGNVAYKITKRTTPTVTIYSPISGLTTRVTDIQNNADEAANSGIATFAGPDGFVLSNTSGGAIASTHGFTCHWVSDAEL